MRKITVGLIGSGFIADYHVHALKRVYGLGVYIKSVAGRGNTLDAFAARHFIENTTTNYRDILQDPEIDVVDICTPPSLHVSMIKDALNAGKHVICEKPLAGYFHVEGERDDIGNYVSKRHMYEMVCSEMEELKKVVEASGKLFMYAENWVYFPSVMKAAEILRKRPSTILLIKGEASHSGSHAHHAAWWKFTGGGSFIRNGCHPLSCAIYLKQLEGRVHGRDIHIKSVVADMGNVTRLLKDSEKEHIDSRPVDVEDLGSAILTFSDDTKAVIISADMMVGGAKDQMEIYTNDAVIKCNAAPHNGMIGYFAGDRALSDIYMNEKLQDKTGWQAIMANEESERGFNSEMQDFMECISSGRSPEAGFNLAQESIKAVYAAYASAEEGRRIDL